MAARPKKRRPGRELEEITAAIEKTMLPPGAVVTSPDFLFDRTNHEQIEVDVTLKYKVDEREVLLVIECRDHGRKIGPKWIRELNSKRYEVGAALIVAVSKSGFTDPAIAKAKFYGIPVKTIEHVTQEEVNDWQGLARLPFEVTLWRPIRLIPVFRNPPDSSTVCTFSESLVAEFKTKRQHTMFAYDEAQKEGVFVYSLVQEWMRREGRSLLSDLPDGGQWVRRELEFSFDSDVVAESSQGKLSLDKLQMVAEVCRSRKELPVKAHRYKDVGTGESSIHPSWLADIAEMFPHGGGEPVFIRIGNEAVFDIRDQIPADQSTEQPPIRRGKRVGVNDPCWCGSGKKYKKCHMAEDKAKAS